MISQIGIKGYKSIKNLQIALGKINILIGGNGVGKSNLISMFSLLRNLYEINLSNYVKRKGGADKILHFGSKNTEVLHLGLEFNNENRYVVDLIPDTNDNLFIELEYTEFNSGDRWHRQEYAKDAYESYMKQRYSGQAHFVSPLLNQFRVYHFHDTGDSSKIKKVNDINDNVYLREDGSNIVAFLYFLQVKHNKHFRRIEKTIKSVAPFFHSFSLKPDRLNEDKIRLEWKEVDADDMYLDATSMSDGTLRFLCLTTLLLQPKLPETIIIDEPELGLHPFAISKLAALIRKASVNSQVIISTQSTVFVDQFKAEDIIAVDRDGKSTVFKRLDNDSIKHWLEDYSMGEIWGKNIIGGQP